MEGVRGAAVNRPVRLLVLTPVPEEGAGCRFRISQFVPALERARLEVTVVPFFDTAFFRLVYRRGHYAAKLEAFVRQTVSRLRCCWLRNRFDLVFVYRGAYPFGPPVIETLLAGHAIDRSSTTSTMPSFSLQHQPGKLVYVRVQMPRRRWRRSSRSAAVVPAMNTLPDSLVRTTSQSP